MCSKGFHNTVSKSDLKDSRVYKYIWFTFHNLVWLMLNYANFDKLKKTKILLRALKINQFEMAQNLKFNLIQQESWITWGGGDSDLKSATIQT